MLSLTLLRNRSKHDGSSTGRCLCAGLRKENYNIKDLVPLLEQVAQQGKPLLIVAEDVEGEALYFGYQPLYMPFACVLAAPGYGDRRKVHDGRYCDPDGGTAIFETL